MNTRGAYFAVFLALVLTSCAKLMEDQPPGSADSTQLAIDTAKADSLRIADTGSKVPERFRRFFYREFPGTVSSTGGRVHTLVVETIMDVTVEIQSEVSGLVFTIKKDGLDITEEPASKWEGRLVPGRYMIAVIPSPHASRMKATPYSLVVKES